MAKTNTETKLSGKRLKVVRTLLRKTQKQFAEALGTTQANLSQIENEDCVPAGNFITRLAQRFPEVNFNYIVYNEGAPLRKDDHQALLEEAKKEVQKEFLKDFDDLNKQIAKLKEDNSNLIRLATKGR